MNLFINYYLRPELIIGFLSHQNNCDCCLNIIPEREVVHILYQSIQ